MTATRGLLSHPAVVLECLPQSSRFWIALGRDKAGDLRSGSVERSRTGEGVLEPPPPRVSQRVIWSEYEVQAAWYDVVVAGIGNRADAHEGLPGRCVVGLNYRGRQSRPSAALA